jgi:hypothetical protein
MNDQTFTERSEEPDRLPDWPPSMRQATKVELVWPGKYNADSTRKEVLRVSLPFQIIETINGSRALQKVASPAPRGKVA